LIWTFDVPLILKYWKSPPAQYWQAHY
jgi:hypothetical protein